MTSLEYKYSLISSLAKIFIISYSLFTISIINTATLCLQVRFTLNAYINFTDYVMHDINENFLTQRKNMKT